MGNRTYKKVTYSNPAAHDDIKSIETWYVRDAQGNVMGHYEKVDKETLVGGFPVLAEGTLALKSQPIYGASRIGQYMAKTEKYHQSLGHKHYELSNHLGNVLSTISDNKYHSADNGTMATAYSAHVLSQQDYMPFGLTMQGRTYQLAGSEEYRFGFNGQEKEKGLAGKTDFGARLYDAAVGRWWSVDPLATKFPSASPYNAMGNNPILMIDPDGGENVVYILIAKGKDGKPALSVQEARVVAFYTNVYLKTAGIKARAFVYDESIYGPLDTSSPDFTSSDNVVYYGANKSDVYRAARKQKKFLDFIQDCLFHPTEAWDGAEKASRTEYGFSGQTAFLDGSEIKKYNPRKWDKNLYFSIVGYMIAHATLHSAGTGNGDDNTNTAPYHLLKGGRRFGHRLMFRLLKGQMVPRSWAKLHRTLYNNTKKYNNNKGVIPRLFGKSKAISDVQLDIPSEIRYNPNNSMRQTADYLQYGEGTDEFFELKQLEPKK